MANEATYWQRFTSQRLTRRRAIAVTGSSAAAAAFLAACGGGSNNNSSSGSSASGSSASSGATGASGASGASASSGASGASNSQIYKPVDTSSSAKAGGTVGSYSAADITHFDALNSNSASTVNYGSVFAYNRLLKFKSGVYPNVADGTSQGEMATSWEISPDKLTVTMKLRTGNGVKWDDRAPTNGREMNMDDVLFSYKKFVAENPSGANVDNSRNPLAPVVSFTAADPTTIVVKLKKPDATIIPLFSATDHLFIMPKESDGGFDPKTVVRGNGPWQLKEYTPSVRFTWQKNPNYYVSNRPFPDILERPIVTEPAQQLSQFRAGNIITDVVANAQQEVIQLKKDVPKANLVLPNSSPTGLTPSIWWGYEGDSPFKDQRVRQAFSMLIDREGYNSAINNADAFKAAGLAVDAKYNTCITAGWGPYWLDPQGKDFGDNAKYLNYNQSEAMKLLSAAGVTKLSTEAFFNNEGTYGPAYTQAVQVLTGFFTNAGITVKQSGFPYSQYLNTYYFGYKSGASAQGTGGTAKGFNGYAVEAERPYASAVNLMLGSWHSKGGAFHGMSPNGVNAFAGDPQVDSMIEGIQAEFDSAKQVSLTHDLIRYITGQSYMIPNPVANRPYTLWWPTLQNVGIKERWAQNNAVWTEEYIDWWLDPSKA